MNVKLVITVSIFLLVSSCNRRLHKCYHKKFLNENISYILKLDSLNSSFSYLTKGGLMDGILEGSYSVRGNKLLLELYTGQAYLHKNEIKADSINIQFINSKDHILVPFVNLNVKGLGEIQGDESGRVSFSASRDQYFIQTSQVNYEDFETTLNNKGDWIIELVPKVSLNENFLKWSIKKGAIKSKHFELEKCS